MKMEKQLCITLSTKHLEVRIAIEFVYQIISLLNRSTSTCCVKVSLAFEKKLIFHFNSKFLTIFSLSLSGLTNLICSSTAFDPTSKRCSALYATPGTKPQGKLSDNPVTKYIASYFGFLFT